MYDQGLPLFQDEADAHLPRIVASLFLSPGGEKFYQLLFHFSTYVVLHVTSKENGKHLSVYCNRVKVM